ncbi:MAG: 2OG-Fe dioxygenase family protein [Sedimenticola sp.]
MPLNKKGFSIISLPPITKEIKESFSDLPFDKYMGKNRYRRFRQYKVCHDGEQWDFEALPVRPYVTYRKYNKAAGGIKRHYEPLLAQFDDHIRQGFHELEIDTSTDWQINVHQYRVIVNEELEGITVPEGIHCDGHDYVMICVFNRHNVTGGEMKLFTDIEGKNCFYTGVVESGQAALLNDRKMFHYVSNIEQIDPSQLSYRDIVVIAISKWEERWYGETFEKEALEEA